MMTKAAMGSAADTKVAVAAKINVEQTTTWKKDQLGLFVLSGHSFCYLKVVLPSCSLSVNCDKLMLIKNYFTS